MKTHKSLQADSAGRVNLGKECAGLLFIVSRENSKLILEQARIVPDKEADHYKNSGLFLSEEEWAKFESLMNADEEPTRALRKLMKS